jgi:hypothetical protein
MDQSPLGRTHQLRRRLNEDEVVLGMVEDEPSFYLEATTVVCTFEHIVNESSKVLASSRSPAFYQAGRGISR